MSKFDYDGRDHGKRILVHKSRALVGQVVEIQVRLSEKGVFSAKYLETWHEDGTLLGLQKKLDEAVKSNGPQEWSYFIEISEVDVYTAKDGSRGNYSRNGNTEKARLYLHYRIIKLSNEISGMSTRDKWRDSKPETYRLCVTAEHDKSGKLEDEKDVTRYSGRADAVTLVPYTPERWAAIERIADMIAAIGLRLREFLNDAKGGTVTFLDDVGGTARLLAPVEPPAALPEKKRA